MKKGFECWHRGKGKNKAKLETQRDRSILLSAEALHLLNHMSRSRGCSGHFSPSVFYLRENSTVSKSHWKDRKRRTMAAAHHPSIDKMIDEKLASSSSLSSSSAISSSSASASVLGKHPSGLSPLVFSVFVSPVCYSFFFLSFCLSFSCFLDSFSSFVGRFFAWWWRATADGQKAFDSMSLSWHNQPQDNRFWFGKSLFNDARAIECVRMPRLWKILPRSELTSLRWHSSCQSLLIPIIISLPAAGFLHSCFSLLLFSSPTSFLCPSLLFHPICYLSVSSFSLSFCVRTSEAISCLHSQCATESSCFHSFEDS